MGKNKIEKLIGNLSKEKLLELKEVVKNNDKETIIKQIDKIIIEKCEQEQDLNHRFTIELMEERHIFDSEQLAILKSHGIKNIQDLIDSDLSTWGLTQQRRIEFEEDKVWYDFRRMERFNKEKQNIKTKKKRK